jgi:hypothetical protein
VPGRRRQAALGRPLGRPGAAAATLMVVEPYAGDALGDDVGLVGGLYHPFDIVIEAQR